MNLHCMVMAGGIGTRFWPLSRQDKPKQFLSLIGDTPLINQTINRIVELCPLDQRWVLGNQNQKMHLESLTDLVPETQILQEPIGKNTAACIGWATLLLEKIDPNAIIAIIPADQWVDDDQKFQTTLEIAAQEAATNNTIVTIGIPPTEPHTGFGYINTNHTDTSIYHVSQFVEKPDLKTAQRYYKDPHFFWNAGIFICKAKILAQLFKTHLPHHYEILSQNNKFVLENYHHFDPISIDYGIMEKATQITRLVPAQFQWNDIGNWRAIAQFLNQDQHQNSSKGQFVSVDSNHNIIYAEPGQLIATADISNMIIVATHDTTLVLPQESDQKIKEIYNQLPKNFQ